MDTIVVRGPAGDARIELCLGDITALHPDGGADVLVVSAFPEQYVPLPNTVIGALARRGVSMSKLAAQKEADPRAAFRCWMSRRLTDVPLGASIGRILCFEPEHGETYGEQIGGIFRSLAPFLGTDAPIRTVATPLVAAGYQGADPVEILRLLVEAGASWIRSGMPLECLRIGHLPGVRAHDLRQVFAQMKQEFQAGLGNAPSDYAHDLFVSYAHADGHEVQWFTSEMQRHRPDLRVLVDRNELNPGAAWQQRIFEALDDCNNVVAFYSPRYLDSKVCLEEFNIALFRHRSSDVDVLMPVYLYTAELPTYMELVQYVDCREFDQDRCRRAIDQLVASFGR